MAWGSFSADNKPAVNTKLPSEAVVIMADTDTVHTGMYCKINDDDINQSSSFDKDFFGATPA
jgi:hypothetical protein